MSDTLIAPRIAPVVIENSALREEWLAAIARLNTDVTQWVADLPGWGIEREQDKEISEESLGAYVVPVLRITTEDPDEELMLEPIARLPRGKKGVVKLYAWPALYYVHLVGNAEGSDWQVLTASGIYLRQDWTKENFLQMAKDLVTAG